MKSTWRIKGYKTLIWRHGKRVEGWRYELQHVYRDIPVPQMWGTFDECIDYMRVKKYTNSERRGMIAG